MDTSLFNNILKQINIEKLYSIPFPVNVVYSAWISSKTVIPPASKMLIEPKVGGIYRLIIETNESISINEGKFLEIETSKLLKYTWEWNGDGEISEICVNFRACHDYFEGLKLFLTSDQ